MLENGNVLRGVTLSVAALSLAATAEAKVEKTQQPNVLFIMVDDMNNYGVLERYSQILTPNIQKLRDASTLFTKSVCAAPVSVPSRTSCFSGLYPCNTGAYLNACNGWMKSDVLNETTSLFEWFNQNGYDTWGSGKSFHSPLPKGRKPFNNPNVKGSSGFGPFAVKKDFYAIQPWDDSKDGEHPDNMTTEAAIDYLAKDHDAPFFLYAGLWKPHTPYTSPKRFFDMYNVDDLKLPKGWNPADFDDVPEYGEGLTNHLNRVEYKDEKDMGRLMEYIRAYCANCSFADWNVGRIMEALESSKYADNTIVVFCSDNGFHCGEKLHWQKGTLWEQAAYVPMMIREPQQKRGQVCNRPVGLIDLYPTLIDMCGIDNPKHKLDGESVVPLLKNPKAKRSTPAITMYDEHNIAIRNDRYRYIQYQTGEEELYDLESDPYEFKNIIAVAKYKSVIAEMKKYIPKSWKPSVGGRREH